MSILSMGQWTTDFVSISASTKVLQAREKDSLEGFLNYALNENPGVIALWACLEGMDIYTSLNIFCGITTNFSKGTQRRRKDTCLFNVEKFDAECNTKKDRGNVRCEQRRYK